MAQKAKLTEVKTPYLGDEKTGIDGTLYTHLLTFANAQVAEHAAKGLFDDERKSMSARITDMVALYKAAGELTKTITIPLTENERVYADTMRTTFYYEPGQINMAVYRDLSNIRPNTEDVPPIYEEEYCFRAYPVDYKHDEVFTIPAGAQEFTGSESFSSVWEVTGVNVSNKPGMVDVYAVRRQVSA